MKIEVDVCQDGTLASMPWTYAYFELAERGHVADPETSKLIQFQGFLGPQATKLFGIPKVN